MSSEAAHKSYLQTADVVFGAPLLLALLLQWLVPFALPQGQLRPIYIAGGAALALAGLALIVLARRELAQHSQPADPGRPTTALVTSEVFSISRNPLYLGVACFLGGAALAANLPWVLMMLPPSLLACRHFLIEPEERYLRTRFGDDYTTYAATVCRWLGRT